MQSSNRSEGRFKLSSTPLAQLGISSINRGTLALIGPPGSGKSAFCESLAVSQIKRGVLTSFITTDRPPEEITDSLHMKGGSQYLNRLVLVDGYTWATGEVSKSRLSFKDLSNPSSLSIQITRILEIIGDGGVFILDSVSTLTQYMNEDLISKIMHSTIARLKMKNSLGTVVVHTGVHSEPFYSRLKSMVDGVIEFKVEDMMGVLYRCIRVYSFSGYYPDTRWFPIRIGLNGALTVESRSLEDLKIETESSKSKYHK